MSRRPPVWVAELSEHFWSLAGRPPAFPRDLSAAATDALPLASVDLSGLRLHSIREFLTRRRLPLGAAGPDRPLRAALYCALGVGYVFLDSDDPPAERRFSLAHELAHYLRDYARPRRRAGRAHGAAALEVLDGVRPATPGERIGAVLGNCPLAPHVHLMGRDDAGRPAGGAEREAELAADRLAFELLAPAECLPDRGDAAGVAARLVAEFGLPVPAARDYAELLVPPPPRCFFA